MITIRKRYRRFLLGVLGVSLFALGGMLYTQTTESISTKTVSVDAMEGSRVIPCGIPMGIYVETDGVLVVGCDSKACADPSFGVSPHQILKKGDYITAVNGAPIRRKSELVSAVEQSGGNDLILDVRRNQETFQVKLRPILTAGNTYRLGVWVRDNTQGIGMVTFLTADGHFGALGHGISDVDTGALMEVSRGLLYNTTILSIVKGQEQSPGELVGCIDYHRQNVRGVIEANCDEGIFGTASEAMTQTVHAQPVQICPKNEVRCGPATILTSIDGTLSEYAVEIESINRSGKEGNKGIVLCVTDERLLAKTGGIVQGMSGSPILQDGRIIGAVTHVFVKDSTKGFGIFIENMLPEDFLNS